MDRNSDSSTDEPTAAEKKMKVDNTDEAAGLKQQQDTEMTSVDDNSPDNLDDPAPTQPVVSTTTTTPVPNSNGASHPDPDDKKTLVVECLSDDTVSSNTKEEAATRPEIVDVDSTTTEEDNPVVVVPPEVVTEEEDFGEPINLRVVFNKQQLNISMPLKKTVGDLKLLVEKETNVAPALQKVVLKGMPKDTSTLESLGVTPLTKIMVIGTTLSDVMAVAKPPQDKETFAEDLSTKNKDASNWCSLTQHKKVVDKGVPDDAMPGILNESEPLPDIPLFGMLNSKGGKVRLTFKLELDELWLGTKERTEKIPIGSIRQVDSQVITGYEHYSILAIQLGPTEASRYFVYWVPNQYVESIKDALSN